MGMATVTTKSEQSETCHLSAKGSGQDEASDDAVATTDNCEETVDLEDLKIASNDDSKKKKAKKKKKQQQHKGKSSGAGGRGQAVMPTQALVDALFPWTAANKPKVGRCAIAERAIKAGEVVVAEHAVAFVPRSQNRQSVCHSCCRNLSPPALTFECPDCKYSVFCEDCEVLATEQHKIWCRVSNRIREIARTSDCDEDLLHLVLELALQRQRSSESLGSLENNVSSRTGAVKNGIIYSSYEDAICLKTHIAKVATEWKTSVRKGCQLLYEELAVENGFVKLTFGVDTLQNLAALVNTNSHGMGVSGSGIHDMDLAVGIFPFVSMLNHSCRPNCCFSSDGRVMYVRAVQDIPKGAELCLSYINLYEPRGVRKIQLAATKHFICCCQRCSEPFASSMDRFLEGFMCPVRGCGGVVVKASSLHETEMSVSGSSLPAPWECDQCSRIIAPNVLGGPTKLGALGEYPWVLVTKAERKLAEAMSVYRERRFKEARVLLEQYVDEFTGKLHPLNVLLFDALTPLMNCCRALGDAAEGSRVCQNILNSMEKVVSGYSLELANFYFCLGEMYKERSESSNSNVLMKHYRKLAQESFQHVRTIRKACLGTASLPE